MKKTAFLVVNSFIKLDKFSEIYDWLKSSAEKHSIALELKTGSDLLMDISSGKPIASDFSVPEFIVFWDKDIYLAKQLTAMGLKLYNSAQAIELCDDKTLTYMALSKAGIRIPKTISAPKTFENIDYSDTGFLKKAADYLGFPFVIKESFGSFGYQVHLARDIPQAEDIVRLIGYKPFLMQEFIKTSSGRDVRINVVGGQVVSSMLRTSSSPSEFRSNLTLGGSYSPYIPTKEQNRTAVLACKVLGLDFGGVDIMFGENDEPVVCEVNSNTHFKTSYECSGLNMADKIFDFILGS